jgi:hypothetical protein
MTLQGKETAMRTKALNPIWFLAALSLAALIPLAARADAHSELVTATTHADLAGQATDINLVHAHLHHTLNCLVGPNGAGYDASQMNPCANAGNGVIPDTADAKRKMSLEDAAKKAQAGIAQGDLAKAKADASATAAALKALQ